MFDHVIEFRRNFYQELKRRVNTDKRFIEATKGINIRVLYVILPDENFPHPQINLFEIEDGKIEEIKSISLKDKIKADVIIKTHYSEFMKIALGKKKVIVQRPNKGKD